VLIGRVVGDVVATIKHAELADRKLLLVQPLSGDGTPRGAKLIAVDAAQAGVGDLVLVIDEGNSAAQVLRRARGAVRTVVVGVIDEVEHDGTPVLD
jgi:ethanolamine utilization protein EutN